MLHPSLLNAARSTGFTVWHAPSDRHGVSAVTRSRLVLIPASAPPRAGGRWRPRWTVRIRGHGPPLEGPASALRPPSARRGPTITIPAPRPRTHARPGSLPTRAPE